MLRSMISRDQQITHDHSIMGTANDKSYDATHDSKCNQYKD